MPISAPMSPKTAMRDTLIAGPDVLTLTVSTVDTILFVARTCQSAGSPGTGRLSLRSTGSGVSAKDYVGDHFAGRQRHNEDLSAGGGRSQVEFVECAIDGGLADQGWSVDVGELG